MKKVFYPRLRQAVLTAVAAGVALFVGRLCHAGLNSLWVVITSIIVLESTTVLSLKASLNRLIATIIGAFAGGIVGMLLSVSPIGVTVSVFIAALCCTFSALANSLRLASLTAAIVVLIPGASSVVTALDRFLDTVLGAGVALAVTLLAGALEALREEYKK